MKLKFKKWVLIIIGTITLSLTMVKSGWIYPYGMGFWGPNGHDGVWHIALAESLARGSKDMPVFSGLPLQNYHLGFDLILALINKLTNLPTNFLYFQILPPVLALLVGYLTYKFVFLWRKSNKEAWWATFFVYFGGSWGWFISFLRGQGLGGESMFWSQQSVSTLINPPFALSLVLILAGLIFSLKYVKNGKLWPLVFAGILFGTLIEIKVYAGALILTGLFITTLIRINVAKRLAGILTISLALSLALFILFNRSAASLVVFQPFWFLETMMGLTDRLGWLRFFSAMTNYRAAGMWPKAALAYLVALIIFLVGNAGTRVVGLWHFTNIKKYSWLEVFLLTIIIFGTIIPMFFLQTGTPWNTIQFFYYSLFFLSLFAGISLSDVIKRCSSVLMIRIIKTVIIILTIPTTIGTLWLVYLPQRPPAVLSNEELRALSFLSRQPGGIVLTYPFDRILANEAIPYPPRPLYLYESSAYVSAFAQKPTFLEDEVNLDITGYNWKERLASVNAFYKNPSQKEVRDFLKTNNVIYIYWLKGQRALLGEGQLGIEKIFENKAVDIYKVD